MKVAADAPKRPALRYHGGKWKLAPWILSYIPPHDHYVEPFLGGGSVLLQKPQVKLETVNDLDGRVVNYFKMLRDRSAELIDLVELTPWAFDEYKLSQEKSDDPIEDARRFHIMCWMSIHGGPVPTGFRAQNSIASRYATPATDLINHDLRTVAKRLRNVQVLNENALATLDRYTNVSDAVLNVDPPYVPETRSFQNGIGGYTVDADIQLHIDAADIIKKSKAMVVLSGYACDLYQDLYEAHGWHRVDKEAQTNSGGKRIESLWLSPRTHKALFDKYSDMPLFAGI